MKASSFANSARNCGAAVLLLSFAIARSLFAQVNDPYDPVIGPRLRIASPANHAVFRAPADIPIFAYVIDAPLTTNVEIFAGTNDLGAAFSLGSTVPPYEKIPQFDLQTPIARLGKEYCFVWTNILVGNYTLTAIAKRTNSVQLVGGLSITSAPVAITVLPSSNSMVGTDVVSIIATDPVAIEGTNSWTWTGPTNANPAWTNWPPPVKANFTNWGPRDALFTVRRFGDATTAATVRYTVGGTATNGVDYIQLPGVVTIPAGGAYALIPVVPMDNGAPYLPKTVILTLISDTNTPPAYILGIPKRAAAIIIHDWPRPLPWWLADGSFHLNAAGPDGAWFSVQTSPDLTNWSPAGTNQVFQGSIDYVDMDAPSNSIRFYTTIPQSTPPPQ